jgi:glycosidase
MQWDASPTGGFTRGTPWLTPVDPGTRNVAAQADDPASLLSLYRRLLAVRRDSPALRHGALTLVTGLPAEVVAWTRAAAEERVLLVANMGDDPASVDLSALAGGGEVVAATGSRQGQLVLAGLQLDPREGLLVRL